MRNGDSEHCSCLQFPGCGTGRVNTGRAWKSPLVRGRAGKRPSGTQISVDQCVHVRKLPEDREGEGLFFEVHTGLVIVQPLELINQQGDKMESSEKIHNSKEVRRRTKREQSMWDK